MVKKTEACKSLVCMKCLEDFKLLSVVRTQHALCGGEWQKKSFLGRNDHIYFRRILLASIKRVSE